MAEDLITRWIREAQTGTISEPVWHDLSSAVAADPEAGWTLVLHLIEAAPDDEVLGLIAAGPLEELILESSSNMIDRLETQARRDPKFRRCLTGVWFESQLPAEMVNRLKRYTSTVLNPLSR